MKIIGISGPAGSGKDTAHQLLSAHYESLGLRCVKLSFAAKLKDICTALFGWDRQRLEDDFTYKEGNLLDDGSIDPICEAFGMTRRVVMQRMGTEAMRDGLHDDVWVASLNRAIIAGEYDEYDIGFVTDCRFINELQFVDDLGGITIQLERPDVGTLTNESGHMSEQAWRRWDKWSGFVENPYDPDTSTVINLANFLHNLLQGVPDGWVEPSHKETV